ncbi:chromosome condensation protein CrcB [candidate division KSB1 bacterium 4484_87]|nr:MAG: chromosome condensation protein CrcB [candidate division KSB1 bacterium 4484_87]
MLKIFYVGIGGFVGAAARYVSSGLVHRSIGSGNFPYGTLFVNVAGCLLIGFFAGYSEARHFLKPEIRLFLLIGVLGSFTTFSTFGYEVFSFARDGEFLSASLNVFVHLLLGLLGVYLGYFLSKLA